jgi:hypothetical protein
MKSKYMDMTCYSILLVAVAVIGIQLSSIGSVSGQEEESNIIPMGQEGQDAQNGPGVFPRVAQVANDEVAETEEVAGSSSDVARNSEDTSASGNIAGENLEKGSGNEPAANYDSDIGTDSSNTEDEYGTDRTAIAQDGADGKDGTSIEGSATTNSQGADGADAEAFEIQIAIP